MTEGGRTADRPQWGPRLQPAPQEPLLALHSHQMAEMTAQQIWWAFTRARPRQLVPIFHGVPNKTSIYIK